MRKYLSLWAAKAAKAAAKAAGFGGGNLPGAAARKIDADILKKLAKEVPCVILITGTNGKTTVSNLLAEMAKNSGKKVIHNAQGNNLITGITACFVDAASAGGRISADCAVIEVDEGTLPRVLKEIKPAAVVINNFFRDQLDRYGEIDALVEKLEEALSPVDTKLILNADDPFAVRFRKLNKESVYFGVAASAGTFAKHEISDSKYCPDCGKELLYSHTHYGHLGIYGCVCGFKRPSPRHEIQSVGEDGTIAIANKMYPMKMKGAHNAYNALAAYAAAEILGLAKEAVAKTLSTYEVGNGRMQKFRIQDSDYILNLVKNPAGVNVTLSEIAKDGGQKQLVLVLNDMKFDGADVSWIWDADFEMIADMNAEKVICGGLRAKDMALRMKYAGVKEERILVCEDNADAIGKAMETNRKTYVLPNYTALKSVRKIMTQKERGAGK